jgi:hypothetical protein
MAALTILLNFEMAATAEMQKIALRHTNPTPSASSLNRSGARKTQHKDTNFLVT